MVTFRAMTETEFQQYIDYSVENYACEHVKAGNWEEYEAMKKATEAFESLLPDGEKTENQKLYTVCADNNAVGMVWLAIKDHGKGFIYDINIWEENQGKGYGKKTMKELEVKAKEFGLNKIGLHVFAHNKVARSLYEHLGYQETDVMMEKTL